ncbi:MAG: MBL fold metallo-hydrolase [Bacteroidetes bacterium]|nr:MAG: MBL fold metallo-hydrolase [Bacteroidota bacterium]
MTELIFLGTGTSQGVPIIGCECEVCLSSNQKDKRLRSSVFVRTKQTNVVIDTGPDFRQQMLRENIKQLDAVVFTHEHKDHIAGLDDVRAFNYILKKKIPVYATARVIKALEREFYYVFEEEKYPGVPELEIIEINTKCFQINDLHIQPVQVLHYQLPVLGFILNKKIAYITDANYISPDEKEKLKGIEVLIINALRREKHISHFTLEEALELVNELQPQKAYFTHISHQLGKHEEVSKELPENVFLAYDGLKMVCY